MDTVKLYLSGPGDIPLLAKLTGLSEAELMETYEGISAEGKLCVFQAEVTQEQYRLIQQWKNDH